MTEPASSLVAYALGLGDDALVLSHRLCEWATLSPVIEEDVALMNIALDLLGQARGLFAYAGDVEGHGRSEDDLAYLRQERDFTNLQITELDNGDFAVTVARQLLFSAYQCELYDTLASSADERLAAIAGKARKETDYHRDHASAWVVRLGDGTDLSHEKVIAGLAAVWPYAGEMFRPDRRFDRLVAAGVAVDSASLEAPWLAFVSGVLREATLDVPETTWAPGGGRQGIHTETFGYLLAEMQNLHRSFPGATW
ncbi:MAG: 1,2-phenylacetyl-CoA epoxidase subunit PaaC [Acidimicrobiales bacterium]